MYNSFFLTTAKSSFFMSHLAFFHDHKMLHILSSQIDSGITNFSCLFRSALGWTGGFISLVFPVVRAGSLLLTGCLLK